MNLILVSPSELVPSAVATGEAGFFDAKLTDQRRLDHLRKVHHAKLGDSFTMGLINGAMGRGTLTEFTAIHAAFTLHLDTPPPPSLPLHLILALPRPRMLARTLENITALGVKKLTLLNTRRVEKSYWQSPEVTRTKIDQHLWLGLEQACDTQWPQITLEPLFKPFVEDRLPPLLTDARGWVAHPHTAIPCPRQLPMDQRAILAVGPEGGFIPYEIDAFSQAGLQPVHLGQRILRVETAVVALLARLY